MPTVRKLMRESSLKYKGTTVSIVRKWKTDTAKEDGEQFERRGPTNRGCRLADLQQGNRLRKLELWRGSELKSKKDIKVGMAKMGKEPLNEG